jgi:hypothetical protein
MRVAACLVLLASLGRAEPALHQQRRVELAGEWQAAAGGWTLRFRPPPLDFRVHVRLALASAPAGIRLNGSALSPLPGRPGVYDASDFLLREENALMVKSTKPPSEAALLITPRVFIDGQTIRVDRGELQSATVVRNTLENTVNVTLWLSVIEAGSGRQVMQLTGDATVPPGTSLDVPARGRLAPGTDAARLRMVTVLEKAEEAMEGAYRFRTVAPVVTAR